MQQIKTTNNDYQFIENEHYTQIIYQDEMFARYYESIDSTNTLAKEKEYISGLFLCGYQTNGYGQRNRTWQSKQNMNVLMTYFVTFSQTYDFSEFAYIMGVAINNMLNAQFQIQSYVKKPNDILVDNKKLAGILIETQYYGTSQKLIVGIGLNHLQSVFEDDSYLATSLALLGITIEYLDLVQLLQNTISKTIDEYCMITST